MKIIENTWTTYFKTNFFLRDKWAVEEGKIMRSSERERERQVAGNWIGSERGNYYVSRRQTWVGDRRDERVQLVYDHIYFKDQTYFSLSLAPFQRGSCDLERQLTVQCNLLFGYASLEIITLTSSQDENLKLIWKEIFAHTLCCSFERRWTTHRRRRRLLLVAHKLRRNRWIL